MKKPFFIITQLLLVFLMACNSTTDQPQNANITSKSFGTLPSGEEVTQYIMTNNQGMEMSVITYGGIITSLTAPDKAGKYEDIVLGFDNLEGYLQDGVPYFGALIGRYGNRIAKGKFTLDSTEYELAINNIGNHLHGGLKGFDKVNWSAKEVEYADGVALELTYLSADGEEGYPGNLETKVTYQLGNDNTFLIDYMATTDKKTVVNLTQHSYFNLSAMKEDVLNHQLMVNADHFLPVDSTLIPTGELRPVEGTPFNFTEMKKVGADINQENQQLTYGLGYDHCWVLNEGAGKMDLAAKAYEPNSGRTLEVYTSEPAIQVYTGNFLDGTLTGKGGTVYNKRSGLCLETQHFPDSPNQPEFPSTELNPGEKYESQTKFVFGIRE
ncbi:galactose-1-epimerase [Marivirga lumbricoides]|uniref:Aldose 1-epimerase n=1 Tax=Marivirga lumbricoides TaxID=1046115 RepID=A0A2T4DLG4_9BACT|nr:galactose-1-epimerase [Marivirga lumbricoides]